MPDYYLIPKRLARRAPSLGRIAQGLEGLIFRASFWILRRMSLAMANSLAGALFALLGPRTEKAEKALDNLAVAFPDRDERWRRDTLRGIFRNLGYAAVELVKLDQIWEQSEKRLEFFAEPRALEYLATQGATVFVTAHVGPWQLTNLVGRQYHLTISTVYAPESNPLMREAMARLRSTFGVGWISSTEGLRPLVRELQAGHSVGLAMDTRLDTGKPVPFFGRDALTNTSAAGLALRTGAALIPVRSERLPGGRFRVTVQNPLTPADPGADPREQALDLTAQINGCFESWIRDAPEQWICLKRRWPKGDKL